MIELANTQSTRDELDIIASFEERERWEDLVMYVEQLDRRTGIKVRTIKHEPQKDRALHLYAIGDLHVGNKLHNAKKLQPVLDFIVEDPDGYVIFLGDQAEVATKTSVGKGLFDENEHLKEQIESLYSLLQPLADMGKIVGIHEGNHEYRVEQMVGVDPMEWLAKWLDVPYLGWQAFTRFHVGKQSYLVHSFHGKSAAQTVGGQINAAVKLMNQVEADLYLSGHTHGPAYVKIPRFVEDTRRKEIVRKLHHFYVCTAWMDYFGGYAEMKALPPGQVAPSRIRLYADQHHIRVE